MGLTGGGNKEEVFDVLTKANEELSAKLAKAEEGLRLITGVGDAHYSSFKKQIATLESNLAAAEEQNKAMQDVLVELKHQNHHTIAEELWRIERVLDNLKQEPREGLYESPDGYQNDARIK